MYTDPFGNCERMGIYVVELGGYIVELLFMSSQYFCTCHPTFLGVCGGYSELHVYMCMCVL